MTTRDHVGRDMVCGQRICCADLWEHCQQVHTNSAPQPAAYDDGVLTLTATITATSPAIFFFVSLHDATRHQWALHASLDSQASFLSVLLLFVMSLCDPSKTNLFKKTGKSSDCCTALWHLPRNQGLDLCHRQRRPVRYVQLLNTTIKLAENLTSTIAKPFCAALVPSCVAPASLAPMKQ